MEERIFKCKTCKKELNILQINFLPGETFYDPVDGTPYSGGDHYCKNCYKDATGETTLESEKQDKKEIEKLTDKKNILKDLKLTDIKDLELKTNNNVYGRIIVKKSERTLQKNGKDLKVADFVIEDDTGSVTLVIWNELIGKIEIGKSYLIKNGYVQEWNDRLQITLGRQGELIKL